MTQEKVTVFLVGPSGAGKTALRKKLLSEYYVKDVHTVQASMKDLTHILFLCETEDKKPIQWNDTCNQRI